MGGPLLCKIATTRLEGEWHAGKNILPSARLILSKFRIFAGFTTFILLLSMLLKLHFPAECFMFRNQKQGLLAMYNNKHFYKLFPAWYPLSALGCVCIIVCLGATEYHDIRICNSTCLSLHLPSTLYQHMFPRIKNQHFKVNCPLRMELLQSLEFQESTVLLLQDWAFGYL